MAFSRLPAGRVVCALAFLLFSSAAAASNARVDEEAQVHYWTSNDTEGESTLQSRADYEWQIEVYVESDRCGGEKFGVVGTGNLGCRNLDFPLDWNSFSVKSPSNRNIVLFRGRGCPYTEDDPFHYDCREYICNLGFGRDVPRSYLVTDSGAGTCNN